MNGKHQLTGGKRGVAVLIVQETAYFLATTTLYRQLHRFSRNGTMKRTETSNRNLSAGAASGKSGGNVVRDIVGKPPFTVVQLDPAARIVLEIPWHEA